MRMDKATDLPIREFSYLKESKPSTMIGFDTRDWDKLEARQYHYIFSAFFLPAGRFPNGFEVLDKMPVPPLQ